MAKSKIPSFLLGTPDSKIKEELQQYALWKQNNICEKLVCYLEKQLQAISIEEEKDMPISEFQFSFNQSKRFGKREVLRNIIEDLKV